MKPVSVSPLHRWLCRWFFPNAYYTRLAVGVCVGVLVPPLVFVGIASLGRGWGAVRSEVLFLLGLSLLGAIVTLWFLRQMLAPIQAIGTAIDAHRQGREAAPLPEFGPDEAGSLARGLRETLDSHEKLQRLKRRLTSLIARDHRGPLTGISLTTELLLNDPGVSQESRPLIDYIKRTTDGQLRQIRGLLESFLDDTRDARITPKSVPLPLLWLQIHDTLGVAALQRQIALEFVPTDLSVQGDFDRLAQVLNNLVANAVKATPARGRVVVSAVAKDGGACEIHVKDTGCGLDSAVYLPLLKLRNSDLSEAEKKKLGLGLRMSEALLNVHGSTLQIRSGGGAGSDVFFELRRA